MVECETCRKASLNCGELVVVVREVVLAGCEWWSLKRREVRR